MPQAGDKLVFHQVIPPITITGLGEAVTVRDVDIAGGNVIKLDQNLTVTGDVTMERESRIEVGAGVTFLVQGNFESAGTLNGAPIDEAEAQLIFQNNVTLDEFNARSSIVTFQGDTIQLLRSNGQEFPDVIINKGPNTPVRPIDTDLVQREGATLTIESGRLGMGAQPAQNWILGSDTVLSGNDSQVFIGPGGFRGNRTITVRDGGNVIHRKNAAAIEGSLIFENGGTYSRAALSGTAPLEITGDVIVRGGDVRFDDRQVIIGGSFIVESAMALDAGTSTVTMTNPDAGATVTLTTGGPLYNLVIDMAGELNLTGDVETTNDLVVYRGGLNPAGNNITARDFILLGADYNPHDPDRALLRLDGDGRRVMSSVENGLFLLPRLGDLPAGPDPGDFSGSLGDLNGSALTVTRNLYVNGADLTGSDAWSLVTADAPAASDLFAEPFATIFNSIIAHGEVTNGASWVSAATAGQSPGEFGFGVTDGGNNSGNWGFTRPEIRRAATVNDRVLYVEFTENVRVVSAGDAISFDGGTPASVASRDFQDVFVLPDGVTWNLGDPLEEGDLIAPPASASLEHIFLRVDPDQPQWRWKTDATGGNGGSPGGSPTATDRDGNSTRDSIPNISLVKGAFVGATSRVPLRNYGFNQHGGNAVSSFSDAEDGAGPMLYRVRFGRAAHTQPATRLYDGHNYLHLFWSEPVDITGIGRDDENIRSELCEGGTAVGHCGDIRTQGNRILVEGYLSFQRPDAPAAETMTRGSRDATPTANALYRTDTQDPRVFPAGPDARAQELRIYLSGWNENEADPAAAAFVGWHADVFDPALVMQTGGNVRTEPSSGITDNEGNRINHHLHPRWERDDASQPHVVVANPDNPAVLFTNSGSFFNAWDVAAPEFSVFFPTIDGIPAEFETQIVDRNDSGFVDAIDIHMLDNGIINFSNALGPGVPDAVLNDPQGSPIPGNPNDPRPLWDPVNASVADRTTSLFTHPNTRPNEGIRWPSLRHGVDKNAFAVGPSGDLRPVVTAVEAAVNNAAFRDLDRENDGYFRLLLPDNQFPVAEPLILRYDESGRVTDVAGNLLRTREIPVRTPDTDAPEVELALVRAGGRRLFLRFSKPVFGANDATTPIAANQLQIPFGPAITGLEIIQTSNDPRLGIGGATEIFLDLSRAVSGPELFTLNLEPVSPGTAIFDAFGNQLALPPATRRITDVAIEAVVPTSAVEAPGSTGNVLGDFRVVRAFDGTEAIAATDITLQARLAAEALGARETELLVIPDPASEDYWSLDEIPGLIASSDVNAVGSRIEPFEAEGRELSFLIPQDNPAIQDGTTLQFQFRMDGLNVARLTNPADPRSLVPWSLLLGAGFIEQRGNVTILNNVIYPARDDRSILAYELSRPGMTTVTVFSLDGALVRTLHRGRLPAGMHRAVWDGRNNSGQSVARGIYFIRVVAPGIDEYRKVMVVRER